MNASAASSWQSPRTGRGCWTRDNGVGPKRLTLEGQAEAELWWPTPNAANSEQGPTSTHARGNQQLQGEAAVWPTPHAHDGTAGGRNQEQINAHRERTGAGARNLHEEASLWPTPTRRDSKTGALEHTKGGTDLVTEATLWATPNTGQGRHELDKTHRPASGSIDLQSQVMLWPTPGANDHKGSAQKGQRRGQLDEMAEQKWPTPRSEDSESSGARLSRGTEDTLTAVSRSFLPDLQPSMNGGASSPSIPASRRRLNPRFVSWLMGWPLIGDTSFDSSATVSSLYKQRMRSALSLLVSR